MRLITYRTERWTEAYHARPEDHGLQLSCTASVPGLPPYVEFSQLDIDCESSSSVVREFYDPYTISISVKNPPPPKKKIPPCNRVGFG